MGTKSSSGTTSGLSYSAAPAKPSYQRFGFLCKLFLGVFVAVWIYMAIENPGCPEHTQVEEFQIEYFLGRWYEMYRSEDDDRNKGECVTAEFLLRSDYLIRVEHSYQDEAGFRD